LSNTNSRTLPSIAAAMLSVTLKTMLVQPDQEARALNSDRPLDLPSRLGCTVSLHRIGPGLNRSSVKRAPWRRSGLRCRQLNSWGRRCMCLRR
jgi:hypothetical protein